MPALNSGNLKIKNYAVPNNSVIIAHPGTQHSQQTAEALQKAGLLKKFYTGYYFDNQSSSAKFLRSLPTVFAKNLLSQMQRRRRADILPENIESIAFFDLIAIGSSRLTGLKKLSHLFNSLHRKYFERYVKQQITQFKPPIFWGYEGSASGFFRVCDKLKICKILDHSTGSVFSAKQIYAAEIDKFPQLAYNFQKNFDEQYYDRHLEELEMADAIIVSSDYAQNNLQKKDISPRKIYKVPYGANFSIFKPNHELKKNDGMFNLLFVGAVSQHKGIMYLLDAVKGLRNVRLSVVGPINLPNSIIMDQPEHINFLGFRTSNELAHFYQSSDAFVFPAIHEGSSVVIYEAMACGLPVITTPNAGSIITHMEDGLIIEPFNSKALMMAIESLQNNKYLQAKLGQAALQKVKLFSWNHYHDRINVVIKEIYSRFLHKNLGKS